ncbi:bifunctional 2-polyprenyl-6-hydroxyphenol methylase/3-demethylubiquinol 3-O-methyltransferase UbiG [Amphiplicatus metriothermophilus]|uniref:Ubiquinone biosynthesis O-methyltransferase n=1 Tax=Amphiplicatus metriothermophilus TaxID=1519374 RepID=A0A239PSE5_9PROT|nr:bifunctional 2-polyprenyl-6-hydroxyphenol methylase/3-demethylubiquinol 3-O-methyltransferase UbiG [Amphiplicatus metriothermophilus]MBB5519141.1 2-polyprenyl-6-hydroxyphenyl methylase/3-demethylubiquinone-9 3-methyltransferase [Amphiplicatus metriothermophilus]SNT73211.1 3-demethylubiquinone-9 3-methyltransferase [Amphiplicatus metriothermophilus]
MPADAETTPQRSSVDPAEIEKFSKMAAEWWDPFGKFRPLHKFNPIRLGYIRDAACAHFRRDRRARRPLEGLRLLDVGCGGGLVCEPMSRLGATVVGIDAAPANIEVAKLHAAEAGLDIDYRAATLEALLEAGEPPFDIVLNLEVVEHVADPAAFLKDSAALVKPGGLMIVATINRTLKAFALAKIGAEYILRWLPRGTHDPRKFLKPEEVKAPLAEAGMTVTATAGVSYQPLLDLWRVTEDTDVNYMVTAVKRSERI